MPTGFCPFKRIAFRKPISHSQISRTFVRQWNARRLNLFATLRDKLKRTKFSTDGPGGLQACCASAGRLSEAIAHEDSHMAGFDKIGKDTGPGDGGFLTTNKETPTKVVFEYILFNYNIDGNILKKEHRELLDRDIIPFVKAHRVHVELTGMASRSGDREYNRQLSLGRVLRVKEYLLSMGLPEAQVPGPDIRAAGEDLSTSKSMEDPMDRAVRLTVAVGIKPRPLFPTIVIPVIITANGPDPITLPDVTIVADKPEERWAIRQIFGTNTNVGVGLGIPGVGVGAGLGPIQYSFLLVNRKTAQMSQCTFAGPGVSGGAGPNNNSFGAGLSIGLSITGQSKTWDKFETASGVDFSDFNGGAAWVEPIGVGAGTDISAQAVLTFPKLGTTVRVTTGKTMGLPGSAASVGNFHCGEPVQLRLP
jgi:outer membrane protein OmpA-like peptidoglycan-associated protein